MRELPRKDAQGIRRKGMHPLSKMETLERVSQEARAICQQVQTLRSAAEKNVSQENANEARRCDQERAKV